MLVGAITSFTLSSSEVIERIDFEAKASADAQAAAAAIAAVQAAATGGAAAAAAPAAGGKGGAGTPSAAAGKAAPTPTAAGAAKGGKGAAPAASDTGVVQLPEGFRFPPLRPLPLPVTAASLAAAAAAGGADSGSVTSSKEKDKKDDKGKGKEKEKDKAAAAGAGPGADAAGAGGAPPLPPIHAAAGFVASDLEGPGAADRRFAGVGNTGLRAIDVSRNPTFGHAGLLGFASGVLAVFAAAEDAADGAGDAAVAGLDAPQLLPPGAGAGASARASAATLSAAGTSSSSVLSLTGAAPAAGANAPPAPVLPELQTIVAMRCEPLPPTGRLAEFAGVHAESLATRGLQPLRISGDDEASLPPGSARILTHSGSSDAGIGIVSSARSGRSAGDGKHGDAGDHSDADDDEDDEDEEVAALARARRKAEAALAVQRELPIAIERLAVAGVTVFL